MWFLVAGFAVAAALLSLALIRSEGPHTRVPPADLRQLASKSWREEGHLLGTNRPGLDPRVQKTEDQEYGT
jgi:hypothetical protein